MISSMTTLKSSPLVLSLSKLYSTYPSYAPSEIDSILIESRFDKQSCVEEIERRIESCSHENTTPIVDGWYQSIDLNLGASKPQRQIEVVRLDTESPVDSHRGNST